MRTPILAAVLAALSLPAFAQVPCRGPDGIGEPGAASDTITPNQFHRVPGRGLACAVEHDAGAAMVGREKPVTFLPCLKVGAVAIADGIGQVEELLGEATNINELDLRTEARVYPIHQRSIPEPYYVVTYQDKVVVAVQLIGPPTEMPATFSGLSLGEPAQKVLDTLGKPTQRCMFQRKGPETWMWPPFPIG
ncbi:MAG: hypothetical protein H7Y60_12605, partial [Rhodospirillaceae bacterium]|nr:hypothetical protein [Rhodospirillales bacterium]